MELKVIEKTKNRMVIEVKDAGHTFFNILKKELWNDDSVTTSAYSVDHPLVGVPKLIVEVKRGNEVADAVADALKRLEKENKDFAKKFKKAM